MAGGLVDVNGRAVGVGDRIYVDLGDSVLDGGEFTDRITALDDLGLHTARGLVVAAAQLPDAFVEVVHDGE